MIFLFRNDYQDKLKEKYIIKLKDKHKENKILINEKDDKIDLLEEKCLKKLKFF